MVKRFFGSSIYALELLELLQLPSHHQAKILQSMMEMLWYCPSLCKVKSSYRARQCRKRLVDMRGNRRRPQALRAIAGEIFE